tara:strand:+ start:2124 stop:3170 length:1047 start_codon:yes stop_codon:yes gene_type:complete
MNKIKLCYLLNNLEEGGAQNLVSNMATCKKIEVTIIIFKASKKCFLKEKLRQNKINIYCLFDISNLNKIITSIINCELLHVHLFPSLYLYALIPKKKIFTEHNTFNRRRKFKFLKKIESFIYNKFDQIICISNPTKTELQKWIGYNDKIKVIENGINFKEFSLSKRVKNENECKKFINIAMSGRFVPQKDQKTLIKSLRNMPENYYLILFGKGPLENQLKILVNKLDLKNRVIFKGWVKDINKELENIDLYIQSSNWEGFGLSILEAMAKGIPVLASKVAGLDQIVGCEKYLFEKGNTDELVTKIKTILNTQKNYMEASEFARKRSTNFSYESMINSYLNIYKNTIKK